MANVINPATLTWTAPTTNADGTPLLDLASYEIKVRATATGPVLKTITQVSAVPNPVPATSITHGSTANPIAVELGLSDGNYLATVTAVDTAGNRSAESATAPFALNTIPPSAPTGLVAA